MNFFWVKALWSIGFFLELKLTSVANLPAFALIGQSHSQTVIFPVDTQLVPIASSRGFSLAVLARF
jgi:hypothetical protein